MLRGIISIILNIAYFIVLRMQIYTDRAKMPNGQTREWQRSPIDRLNVSGRPFLLYLQIFFAAVSVITSLLLIFGVKHSVVKIVQLAGTAASTLMFVIIMIVTGNTHVNYA